MPISRIKTDGIQDDAITSAKIGDTNIQSADIADSSVTTAKIAAGAVTSAKLDTNIDVAGTLDVTGTLTADSNVSVAGNINLASNQEINIPSASVDFDIKSFAGAADYLALRSTYSGSTYTGIKVDYLGRVVAPYGITLGVAESSGYVAANSLDDYEEGTFTPTMSTASSHVVQQGFYTKVGRIVHCQITLQWVQSGTTTGRITGLPFTIFGQNYATVVSREWYSTGNTWNAHLEVGSTQTTGFTYGSNSTAVTNGGTLGLGLTFVYRVS